MVLPLAPGHVNLLPICVLGRFFLIASLTATPLSASWAVTSAHDSHAASPSDVDAAPAHDAHAAGTAAHDAYGATARDVATAPSHDAHATAPASPEIDFDSKVALAQSQAAIGRVPHDAVLQLAGGQTKRLSDFRGKPVVLSLIYTSCYHVCPAATQHLAKVVRGARDALGPNSFSVITIGFDTPNDTPQAMAAFARAQNVAIDGWEFAAVDAPTIARLTGDLGFRYVASAKGFDHLLQATILDANGKIYRQVYGGAFDTPLLVEPLKELVYGTPTAASFLSSLGNRIKLFCTVYDPTADRYRFDYSIFLGALIGFGVVVAIVFVLVREWRRTRAASV